MKLFKTFIFLTLFLAPTFLFANTFIQPHELKGKWVILTYWSPLCHICKKEVLELNDLYDSRKDILVVGQNWDRKTGQDLLNAIDEMKIQFPTLNKKDFYLDAKLYGVLPVTFIISPRGEILYELYGKQKAESLARRIDNAKRN